MKHARPHNHIRVVNTRRGRIAIRVNPLINKRITNKQYKKVWKQLRPNADYDKDGVKNIKDCRPFDRKRQDISEFDWGDPKSPSGIELEKKITSYDYKGRPTSDFSAVSYQKRQEAFEKRYGGFTPKQKYEK